MPSHSGRVEARRWISLLATAIASRTRSADRPGLALEPLAQHAQGDVGGLAAGRLPANAVDDDEQAARLVNVEAILVDLTLEARIGVAGGRDRGERRHRSRVQLRPVLNSHIWPGHDGDERDQEHVARQQEQAS